MAVVSIVVPVYKVAKYLPYCVNSILRQSFQDYELILVNDGSPDQCGQICEDYAEKYDKIIALHRENGGLSAARNTGIEWTFAHSGSEYITFIDSDDWVHPRYLELLVQAIQNSGAAVSVGGFQKVDTHSQDSDRRPNIVPTPAVMGAEDFLLQHQWDFNYAWGKLYRRKYFAEVRYPEGKNFEDTFTTYKILFAGKKVAFIDHPLYYYFYNPEGISHSRWTPSELVVMEGIREQIRYYREHGYQRALEKEEELYVNHHAYQITRIRANREDLKQNASHLRRLRREMMKLVRENPEKYGYRKMPQCYEAAYPGLMEIYHRAGKLIRAIQTKMKGKNEWKR